MYNKNIFTFISSLFYGGFFIVFFREIYIVYYDFIPFATSMIVLWVLGTYFGLKFINSINLKTDKNIKNIILWIYLSVTLVLYLIKLTEKLDLSRSLKIHLLFIISIVFSSFLLGFLIKTISLICKKEDKYSVKLLLFGIGLSPLLIYFLIASGLNNWFCAMALGITYIGFLIIFIEKGRNKLLPILYVVPVFAFAILGNNNILKKESSEYHLIKNFETETGQYYVVDKNKKVFFYRNFKKFLIFPYSNNKIKKLLYEKGIKFGDILILNNNPAIINNFISIGLFNIDFFLGEKKFFTNLTYDFPSIIKNLLESNVKIIDLKNIRNRKKYDLILLPEYKPKELFSEYFYNRKRLLQITGKLKKEGIIISISKANFFPYHSFDKIDKNIYGLRKTKKNTEILKNSTKKRNIGRFLTMISVFLPLYLMILISKKRKYLLVQYSSISILFILFSFIIYDENKFDLYNKSPLIFSSLFIGIWLGYLLLSNIKISKIRITLYSIFPFIILCFLLFNYIDLLFYISQFLFGFLFIGLFLTLTQ